MTQPWPIAVATIQSEQQTHNGRAGQRTQRLHARCLCPDNKLQGSCATRSISLQRARACLTVIAQRRHCRGMVIFCMIPDVLGMAKSKTKNITFTHVVCCSNSCTWLYLARNDRTFSGFHWFNIDCKLQAHLIECTDDV